jgi:hypothetical protein
MESDFSYSQYVQEIAAVITKTKNAKFINSKIAKALQAGDPKVKITELLANQ